MANPGKTKDELLERAVPFKQMKKYEQLCRSYGIHTELDSTGENYVGDCPFYPCREDGKVGKFGMNASNGQFQCWVCTKSGNAYTFIREIHAHYLSRTTSQQLEQLRLRRNFAISEHILREMQVAWNDMSQEWMLPSWGQAQSGIINLYRYAKCYTDNGKEYHAVLSGPDFKHVPYGVHRLRTAVNRPLVILEGHWDYLAFASLLHRTGEDKNYDCLGATGTGAYPESSIQLLGGRDVILCFDHDQPGRNAVERMLKLVSKNNVMPRRITSLNWPQDLPDGFDISDAITSLPQKHWKRAVKQ